MLDDHPGIEAVVTHVLKADAAADAFAIAKDLQASGKVLVSLV